MATVGDQVQSTDEAICLNIATLRDDRGLLSRNLLAQLRNLVEGVAVLLHTRRPDIEYRYADIKPALSYVAGQASLNHVHRFHKLLQISASHYTLDGDASERLMLNYYSHLHRLRSTLRGTAGLRILRNLEDFPVDLDPSLREYHQRIAERIEEPRGRGDQLMRARYYIEGIRPFFVRGRIYYEVTFVPAVNKVSKFDRIISFTDIDIAGNYSALLTLQHSSIDILEQTMPITIVREWEVSIRPCELTNFIRIFGRVTRVHGRSAEYRALMRWLTTTSGSLLDLIDMSAEDYANVRATILGGEGAPQIVPVLDAARALSAHGRPGVNVVRYLMLRLRNQVVKAQYESEPCSRLSDLRLKWGCIPFDQMPLCTSLPDHNPRYHEVLQSIGPGERPHELLARKIRNNVEQRGVLYTSRDELTGFGDVSALIASFNEGLYHRHAERRLIEDRGHVFIKGYEDGATTIIERLVQHASAGIAGYTQAVDRWLEQTRLRVDDPVKMEALRRLFAQSRVAVIYGAAGTGKSTMVDLLANYFNERSKLFLAHTNPATDNLRRKVSAQNSEFRTIRSQIVRSRPDVEYDLLVIDECSTVSNVDLLRVLDTTTFRLLVLVGDIYQIESIQFGNWFGAVRSFLPGTAAFELTTPFRTSNPSLLDFWSKVRNLEGDLAEAIARNGYSGVLDRSLFTRCCDDEIILCLNYDGLYGINNVNRFLQSSNPSPAISWGVSTYKVGDPVLFGDNGRFSPVIHNNLKGRIVAIELGEGEIRFDVDLDRSVSEFDEIQGELEWVRDSIVRFSVYDYDASDEDDDSLHSTVPFQVAYAVSIHKAQGLEYDSVKVVITDANEDDVTHSIFYTAVTRARERLRIFWTPETQNRVLQRLRRASDRKDVRLLSIRRNLALT